MTKQELLKTHFGYDTFREGQEAVIDALLAGKDVLAVMPTGVLTPSESVQIISKKM